MKVEDLAIELRNRSYWEAIDLGFALSRQWFFRLWGAWLIAALPVFILTMTLIYFINDEITQSLIFILFWWCKPLYEQPLLHILSRQLFSEPVPLRDVLRNYIIAVKPQLPALLLWRRFSLSRSFNNPVAMLEGLTKKDRRNRLNVLHTQQSSASQWLTIVCLLLEFVLYLSALVFIFALVPSELNYGFTFWDLLGEESATLFIITNIAYFFAISIIAPMYVSAGFALYITRRVKLEGWDIELAFKRMKNRVDKQKQTTTQTKTTSPTSSLGSTVACLILSAILSFTCLLPTLSHATNNDAISIEESKITINEVLLRDDFGKKTTKKEWVYVGSTENENEEESTWLKDIIENIFSSLFSDDAASALKIFEIIIWLAVASLILWLIYKYSHWLNWITLPSKTIRKRKAIPNTILGMDMKKDSLPDDVMATFSSLIDKKQYREALSLLYRATLSEIVHAGDIDIPDSATEQECSEMVSHRRNKNESSFFAKLTHAWILLAYADRDPSMETLSSLRDEWKQHYLANNSKQIAKQAS